MTALDHIAKLQLQTHLASLPLEQLKPMAARANWRLGLARPEQLPPADQTSWDTWLLLAGRGFGKTRSAAEWIWWEAWNDPDSFNHVVTRRSEDLAKVAFEGPSGLFRLVPPDIVEDRLKSPYKIKLINGASILGFSADDPDVLRGPEAMRTWSDELAAWRRLDAAWNDGVLMGTRLGSRRNAGVPKHVITTTPRPIKLLKEIRDSKMTVVSRGSTFDNAANLAPSFLEALKKRFQGTRRGRQELLGEYLEDVPGALWLYPWIEDTRLWEAPEDLVDVVVGVDPPASSDEGSNECGIIAAGRDRAGRGYVLADRSDVMSPEVWGEVAIRTHDEFRADHITVERNNGGEMCVTVLKTAAEKLCSLGERSSRHVVIRTVWASRGKEVRAEPVSQAYEQRRVSHVGEFPELEDQLVHFTKQYDRRQNGSPDRLDALVWALTDLVVDPDPLFGGISLGEAAPSIWSPIRSNAPPKISFGV